MAQKELRPTILPRNTLAFHLRYVLRSDPIVEIMRGYTYDIHASHVTGHKKWEGGLSCPPRIWAGKKTRPPFSFMFKSAAADGFAGINKEYAYAYEIGDSRLHF